MLIQFGGGGGFVILAKWMSCNLWEQGAHKNVGTYLFDEISMVF